MKRLGTSGSGEARIDTECWSLYFVVETVVLKNAICFIVFLSGETNTRSCGRPSALECACGKDHVDKVGKKFCLCAKSPPSWVRNSCFSNVVRFFL